MLNTNQVHLTPHSLSLSLSLVGVCVRLMWAEDPGIMGPRTLLMGPGLREEVRGSFNPGASLSSTQRGMSSH